MLIEVPAFYAATRKALRMVRACAGLVTAGGLQVNRFFVVLIVAGQPHRALHAFETPGGALFINDDSPFLCLVCPVLAIVDDEIWA